IAPSGPLSLRIDKKRESPTAVEGVRKSASPGLCQTDTLANRIICGRESQAPGIRNRTKATNGIVYIRCSPINIIHKTALINRVIGESRSRAMRLTAADESACSIITICCSVPSWVYPLDKMGRAIVDRCGTTAEGID